MPNVVGMLASEAKQTLGTAGFTNVTFVSGDDPGEAVQLLTEWKVTKQSVDAGSQVAVDAPIELEVTKLGAGRG